jgi:threonine ammonia-lyase medium form
MITIDAIVEARDRIAGKVHRTPFLSAKRLGEPAGVSLSLKCESFQKTGSFKVRGALNAVLQLVPEQRARGVVTVSAGNHAQAVAYAAAVAGVKATVVMPATASPLKVAASRGYGAEVVLHGASGIEAFAHSRVLEHERGLVFVHPFDDVNVQAGAGTVGLELIDDDRAEVDVLVVGIGGGGLISGVATAVRALSPRTRIVGVEPEGSAVMRASLDAGKPVRLEKMNTIADGLAAPMAGDVTYPMVRDLVDDVVLVSDDEIREALRGLLTSAKLVAEPAAAASLAAVTTGRVGARPGARVVAIVSGGNIDLTRLAEIAGAQSA